MQDHLRYAALAAQRSDSELVKVQAGVIDPDELTGEQQAALDEISRREFSTDDHYHRLLRLAPDTQEAADDASRINDDILLISESRRRASFFRARAGEVRRIKEKGRS